MPVGARAGMAYGAVRAGLLSGLFVSSACCHHAKQSDSGLPHLRSVVEVTDGFPKSDSAMMSV